MTHEVYVWQRKWTPEVRNAIERAAPAVEGFTVLIGEADWKQGAVQAATSNVDYAALARTGKPVGLGLRIGSFDGKFSRESALLQSSIRILRDALKQAEAANLKPCEVQIDFDCASSKLADYAVWVRELHMTFPDTPLTVTALPDWVSRPEFSILAKAASGFILQVHSVPGAPGAAPVLCDLAAARKAVARASRIGAPFRVALPTYGCEVFLDARGRVVEVRAEEAAGALPANATHRTVLRADAGDMAGLVREWKAQRPAGMSGVIWYRLPLDNERFNWRWETLAAILDGRTPVARGSVTVRQTAQGLADIVLENRGNADWLVPDGIALHSHIVASDGVNGFEAERDEKGMLALRNANPLRWLPPGGHLLCGWVRSTASGKLTAEITFSRP